MSCDKYNIGDKVVRADGCEWANGDEYKTVKTINHYVGAYTLSDSPSLWYDHELNYHENVILYEPSRMSEFEKGEISILINSKEDYKRIINYLHDYGFVWLDGSSLEEVSFIFIGDSIVVYEANTNKIKVDNISRSNAEFLENVISVDEFLSDAVYSILYVMKHIKCGETYINVDDNTQSIELTQSGQLILKLQTSSIENKIATTKMSATNNMFKKVVSNEYYEYEYITSLTTPNQYAYSVTDDYEIGDCAYSSKENAFVKIVNKVLVEYITIPLGVKNKMNILKRVDSF